MLKPREITFQGLAGLILRPGRDFLQVYVHHS